MKNITSGKVKRSAQMKPKKSASTPANLGIYRWEVRPCPTGEMEDVYVIQDKDEYDFKFSNEIFETFKQEVKNRNGETVVESTIDLLYFYSRIGHGTAWSGRLSKKQSTGRGLSLITGFNPNICLVMKARLLKCGFAYIDNNGMLCFKSIQDHRSHKDYINIKLNTKQSIKEGQIELQKRYVNKRIRAQEKRVEFNGTAIVENIASQQSSDNRKSTIRLSSKTLSLWIGCTKSNASLFKKKYLTDYDFNRDVQSYGQYLSEDEMSALKQTNNKGMWILSSKGYFKHEGCHIVTRREKPRQVVGMVSLLNNKIKDISGNGLTKEEMSYLFEEVISPVNRLQSVNK